VIFCLCGAPLGIQMLYGKGLFNDDAFGVAGSIPDYVTMALELTQSLTEMGTWNNPGV
jgi:hypothetical protein